MKRLSSIILLVVAVILYLLSILNWSFWTWVRILAGSFVFSIFILPYVIAKIINVFVSKGKLFSITLDQLSPFGLNARNVRFTVNLKGLVLTGSVDKIGLQTNFRKFFFNIGTASPFVFEVGTFALNIVPNTQSSSAPVSSIRSSENDVREPAKKDKSAKSSNPKPRMPFSNFIMY